MPVSIVNKHRYFTMSTVPSSTKPIPTLRRVTLNDSSEIPERYSHTPGGTMFSTTPGGTRIIYERKFLLDLRQSPLSKSPPKMNHVAGITKGASPTKVVGKGKLSLSLSVCLLVLLIVVLVLIRCIRLTAVYCRRFALRDGSLNPHTLTQRVCVSFCKLEWIK